MPRPLFAKRLSPQEQRELDALLCHSVQALAKRAAIILLSSQERYRVSEIATFVDMHVSSVRYWIHQFNEGDIAALRFDEGSRRVSRVAPEVCDKLILLAATPPRELGLKFTTWTLRQLREYLIDHEIVEAISHETIRRILKNEGIDWQASGTLPENSRILDLLENTISQQTLEVEELEKLGGSP